MKRLLIALAILALVLIAVFKLRRSESASSGSNESSPSVQKSTAQEPVAATHSTAGPTFRPLAQKSSDDPNRFFDLNRPPDAHYSARIQKHLTMRWYYNSPAKETDECKRIVQMLAQEGLGLDVVGYAYGAAWDNKSKQAIIEQAPPGKKEEAQKMVEFYRLQNEEKLRGFGITNQAFFDELFAMRPTVFFGLRDVGLSQGEELLQ